MHCSLQLERSLIMSTRLLLLVSTILCLLAAADCSPAEDRLLAELFKNREYNRLSSPVTSINDTIHVKFKLTFVKLVQMDEHAEVLHAIYWYQMTWNDYRIKWNASEFDGRTRIYVPVSDVWVPEIILWNKAKSDAGGPPSSQSSYVRLGHDGVCEYWPFNDVSVSHCPMDITWFPFDDQHCQLLFESWISNSREMLFSLCDPPVTLTFYQPSSEWELIDIPVSNTLIKYGNDDVPYSRLVFTVRMRRKAMYYVINFVVPCCIFSILAVVTFLLPPTCGERIGIGITILLALSVYQTIVNDKLPTTSDEVPLLGIYFLLVMIMCGISVSITMLGMYLHHLHTLDTRVPILVKRIICGHLALFLCFKRSHRKSSSSQQPVHDIEMENRYPSKNCAPNDQSHADGKNLAVRLLDGNAVETVSVDATAGGTGENSVERPRTVEIDGDWIQISLVVDRLGCVVVFTSVLVGTCVIFLLAANKHHFEKP